MQVKLNEYQMNSLEKRQLINALACLFVVCLIAMAIKLTAQYAKPKPLPEMRPVAQSQEFVTTGFKKLVSLRDSIRQEAFRRLWIETVLEAAEMDRILAKLNPWDQDSLKAGQKVSI